MATQRLIARGAAVLLALSLAASAAAQSTRVDAIAQEQAEKSKQLGTEGPSDAEKIVRRVLLSPLLNGGDGAYPWFGSIYGGTGMALGAGFLKRLENAAFFDVHAGISLNNSMLVRGTFATPELWRGILQVDASAQWMDARGVSFYGFGQDSELRARERFDYTPTEITGNVTLKPRRHVSMIGSYSLLDFSTARDVRHFQEDEAPGLDRSLRYHVTRGTLTYDWRPAAGYSTRGGFHRVTLEHNYEARNRPYTFNAVEYEAVQLVPLVREQFVLAGRALMTMTTTADGHAVPIPMAPYLGSGSAVRGYANRRFTDRHRVLLSGEYRWRPSRYLDMALFVDAGQVAADRGDFDLGEFDSAWGIGARFHGPSFNALRVEIARGREGIRLVFAGSQPF